MTQGDHCPVSAPAFPSGIQIWPMDEALESGSEAVVVSDRLVDIIAAIGTEDFAQQLLSWLRVECGVQHCSMFIYDDDRPILIGSASADGSDTAYRQVQSYLSQQRWKDDPMVTHVLSATGVVQPQLMRVCVADLPGGDLRDSVLQETECREWLAIFGGSPQMTVALNMHRPFDAGLFSQDEVARLKQLGRILLTMLVRHVQIVFKTGSLHSALTSLDEIEVCLGLAPLGLANRELQVCARMIYGMCVAGIALDLAIGEQTVITYRKRAYRRLGIGSHHELLVWYAAQWGEVHSADDQGLRASRRAWRSKGDKQGRHAGKKIEPSPQLSPAFRILLDLAHVKA